MTYWAKYPPGAGRTLQHGDEGIGNTGCVLFDSGYVPYNNLEAVSCSHGLTRFVLGGRNEKY